ncbi:hypothetical protein IE4872_PC00036 (plasmid) [Rhizobium gallicum]|uniref:Uncharacterized protein n=1 Tax=Rhizobium gallicum TaxID=56730 RepID=A0A1L5NQF1_9HYPH|nr:hypothetical protein [Rhizobium gallicum]APO70069.1 hypothetical protein IE4872_PC00036 [Rhizobium gallicum]
MSFQAGSSTSLLSQLPALSSPKSSQVPFLCAAISEGMWEYATADGGWATVTNGYKQALQRKNILRNAMGRLPEEFHPEAHVVFSDDIPEGSNLTPGNFKAHVGGFGGLSYSPFSGGRQSLVL